MATVVPQNPFGNIMDIFRGSPVNPQQQGGPGPQGNNTDKNGVVPPNGGPNGDPQNPQNQNQNNDPNNQNQDPNKQKAAPLDEFKTLWEPVKADPNNPDTGLDFNNIDPQKMMEAARKVDFTQILTPEIQASIAKGGEEGVKATISAMNQMNQLVYGQSAMATTKIVGAAVENARQEFAKQIPGLVKAAALQSNLVKANPVFQNPAVTPIVEGLKSQLLIKFPNATSDQLTEMAQSYFLGVAQSIPQPGTNSQNPDANKKKAKNMTGKGDEDWGDFFDLKL